jgi:hypothetical protein
MKTRGGWRSHNPSLSLQKILGFSPKKGRNLWPLLHREPRVPMTVLVLMLIAVLVLPLLGLSVLLVAFHAAVGITVWLVGGQLLVAGLILSGAILAGVYYGRRHPIR